jgi:type IV fimbrial biogenesis protein FimT
MRHSRAMGFSLIELMITIGIVGILLAVAFPSFEGAMRSNRVATASNELLASFSLARSEALRSPGGSFLCTSTSGTACTAGSTWNDGWIIWPDLDADEVHDANERVIRYVRPNDRLTFTGTSSGLNPTVIRFDPRGRIVNNVTHAVTLLPINCPAGQQLQRSVALNATGQARISKANCT